MPNTKPDFHQTADTLRKHDNFLKFSLFGTAGLGLFSRRIGLALGLASAFYTGARQLPAFQHKKALEANKDIFGNLPQDPYPGFFGGSDVVNEVSNTAQEQFQSAKQFYKDSGAEKFVEEFTKSFGK